MLTRDFFLFLSRQASIRKWVETSESMKNVTRRFVAGETLEEELAVCAALQQEGIFSSLDHLGENVNSIEEAAASRDAYLGGPRPNRRAPSAPHHISKTHANGPRFIGASLH